MDMQINKTFLRQEREKRAWSQSHLAEVADLSMRTVQRIEHSGVASMESAKALAAALDVELAVLTEPADLAKPSSSINPHISRRYRTWGGIGALLAGLAALGWWSTVAAEQVMINLSVKAESGASTRGEMQFLNELGVQNEVKFERQFRLLVTATRQEQHLLLSTEIYDFVDGDYRLVSTPVILVADNEQAGIHLSTQGSGLLELDFKSDF